MRKESERHIISPRYEARSYDRPKIATFLAALFYHPTRAIYLCDRKVTKSRDRIKENSQRGRTFFGTLRVFLIASLEFCFAARDLCNQWTGSSMYLSRYSISSTSLECCSYEAGEHADRVVPSSVTRSRARARVHDIKSPSTLGHEHRGVHVDGNRLLILRFDDSLLARKATRAVLAVYRNGDAESLITSADLVGKRTRAGSTIHFSHMLIAVY